jgi:HK97 family phage portal protein
MLKRIKAAIRRFLMSTTSRPAQWFIDWVRGGHESDSGISLDGKTVLRYAPVWYAVRRISGHVAQLPLVLYRRDGERGKERAAEHPAYAIVKRRPNAMMTASVFRELLQYHALVWGNGRAAIARNRRGDPIELIPLLPDRTVTVLVNGAKWHVSDLVGDDGTITKVKFPDADVLHIVGLGYDGLAGYPLWELAKNSWGMGMGAEKFTNRFYRNNAVPGLILEAPAGVLADDEEAKKFLAAFREMQEGLDNVNKTALLREGIKATKLANSAEESQTIETRQFQRQEVALWFLLEAITGDDKSVSYSSLEQKHLAYLVNCLNGWLVKWQEQCEDKLLREREKAADSHLFRFSTGALLRSDMATTVTTLTTAVRGMLMTVNEARDLLDMNPMEGGDVLVNPAITPGPAGGGDQGGTAGDGRAAGREPAGEDGISDSTGGLTASRSPSLQARLQAVIRGRLQELAAVETKRAADLASRPEALAEWYERWEATLGQALVGLLPVDLDNRDSEADRIAVAWVGESQDRLRRGVDQETQRRIELLVDCLAMPDRATSK